MIAAVTDTLIDAGAHPVFWAALATVMVIIIVAYVATRGARISASSENEHVKVIQDWTPTGRIDFVAPSMDENASDAPASIYLQAEDTRHLVSFSGIERKEMRWRKATVNEAKQVAVTFHRQMTGEPKLFQSAGNGSWKYGNGVRGDLVSTSTIAALPNTKSAMKS